jgi:tRNA-binding protein
MKPAEIKPEIQFDTFASVDIRVGTIQSIHDVVASSKLVRLVVDFGDHTRNILAGIKKERRDVHEIVGKQALFVVNLPARTMAGEVSEGMLFDLGYADGIEPVLAIPEHPVPDGSRAA